MSIRVFAAVAAALALAAPAGAQSRPRPDDTAVKTPPPAQASAFEGYRRFRDEQMVPWREVNDEVGRLGGHGHMRAREGRRRASDAGAVRPAPRRRPRGAAGGAGGQKHAH